MTRVINIVGKESNVGKTVLIEGLIRVFNQRGYRVATIKHDVHGFDMDYEGKDTYRHRQAGAETVIISSSTRMAMIQEVKQEILLNQLIQWVQDKDIVLVEGYKDSKLRKIEVLHDEDQGMPRTPKEYLIAVACHEKVLKSNQEINKEINKEKEYTKRAGICFVDKTNYTFLADCIEREGNMF